MRIVSATVHLDRPAAERVVRRVERRPQQGEREGDARPGPPVRPVLQPQPTAMRLDQPPADEQPEAGAGDARFADVPGPMERFRDERPFRGRDPDPLVVDGDDQPFAVDRRRDRRRRPSAGPYLKAFSTRFSRIWPTRAASTSSGGRSSGRSTDEPVRPARRLEVAPQARDERREGDRARARG